MAFRRYLSFVFILLWLLSAGCSAREDEHLLAEKKQDLQVLRQLRVEMQRGNSGTSSCEANLRPGKAGATDDGTTAKGIVYIVRTPNDYDPRIAYPLLVVYAPAGTSAARSERFTDLTPYATAVGFITAYASARRMSIATITELSTIPSLIAKKWCIDEKRVYLTGHSDGGTVSLALGVLEQTRGIATAIAPSAAGMRGADLAEFSCPLPLPVMVMHSADDTHFPEFGSEVAAWWASCNKCDAKPNPPMENSCVVYPNCADGVTTWYCEGKGSHSTWPALNVEIVKFFATTAPSQSSRQSAEGHLQMKPNPPDQ